MTEQTETSLQTRFFRALKEMVPVNKSFVDIIADLLEISTDSVYRRLRGATALSLEEVSFLCNHFRISFDMFSKYDSGNVTFHYSLLNDRTGFKKYLETVHYDLVKMSEADPCQIVYAAIDVPIFHHFNYPALSAFKMFYWLKAVVNDALLEGQKFDRNLIDPELAEFGKKIYELYCRIPSIEIWTSETINSLIKQIEFFWDSGMFQTKEDALIVCQQAKDEITQLQKQAESGFKDLSGKRSPRSQFMLYQSEIEIGNNCILINKGENKSVYLSIHTFNKILTANKKFCEESSLWIDNLVRKSIPISNVSEKVRYKFFRKIFEKIDHLIAHIEEV